MLTVNSITSKYDWKEFKVRRAINRLYILNRIAVKSGNKTRNYVLKNDNVTPVIRKRKKPVKKEKDKTMNNLDMLRKIFDTYGKKAFSVEDAAEVLFPDVSEQLATSLVSKLIVKSSKAYQIFDYRDLKVSDEYGGITNVTEELAAKAKNQRIFVFRSISSLDRDKRVLNTVKQKTASQKEGFYKKDIVQMFPAIGESTVNRSLVRLWVTRKIEKTAKNRYVPSDGKAKVLAPNSNVKVDKEMYDRVDYILSNTWDVFTELRNKFKNGASVEQIVHFLWKDKTHIVKYPDLIDETIRSILKKGEVYKVFKIDDKTKDLRAQVVDLCHDHYKERDLEFLEIVDLKKGSFYTMHDIEERYRERVLDTEKRDVFRTLVRLRIMGILKKIPEKKEHGKFVFEYLGVGGDAKKEEKTSVPRNTSNVVSFKKPEFAEEDKYEESLEEEDKSYKATENITDHDMPKEPIEKQPIQEFVEPVSETLIYSILQRINDDWYCHNFELDHFKSYFNCDDSDVNSLIRNQIIGNVGGDLYSFMLDHVIETDNNMLYSVYEKVGMQCFYIKDIKDTGGNLGVNSLFRLVLEKRIKMDKVKVFTALDTNYEYRVDPKEVGFSGDNSSAQLDTVVSEPKDVKVTPPPPSIPEVKIENNLIEYCLNVEDNPVHDMLVTEFESKFVADDWCTLTLRGNTKLLKLLFRNSSVFEYTNEIKIYELDFSVQHMFSEQYVGNNKAEGYLVNTENYVYLFVPEKIPVLE